MAIHVLLGIITSSPEVTPADINAINNRMYLISDNDAISTPDLIYKVAEAMEKKIILFNFPIILLRFLAALLRQTPKFERLSNNLVINNSKFKKDYNWSPRFNIDTGIRKSFKKNWEN